MNVRSPRKETVEALEGMRGLRPAEGGPAGFPRRGAPRNKPNSPNVGWAEGAWHIIEHAFRMRRHFTRRSSAEAPDQALATGVALVQADNSVQPLSS